MPPIQFSVCGSDEVGAVTQAILEPYNALRHPESRVQVTTIPWEEYQHTLTQIAVYDRGAGVAQVGAPVVNDLVAMNALRPFSNSELAAMGGQAAFSKIAWENTNRVTDGQVWAVPWLVDPRGFIYWRDMLQEAKVDEQTAFQTFENVEETLQRLQKAGHPSPLGIPIRNAFVVGQASCSWIWGAGADFLSPDGKQTYVTEPAFLEALHAYFRLAPYLAPDNGDVEMADRLITSFLNRQCAVFYGSLWVVADMISNHAHPLRSLLGMALPPGPTYAGGSNLVIWKNTRNEQAAVDLVQYLVSREAQTQYPLQVEHLPARQEILDQPPFSTDPILSGFVRLANGARPFPTIKLGGLLETLYCASIARIWARISSEPELNLKTAIQSEMAMLSRRYEKWLS